MSREGLFSRHTPGGVFTIFDYENHPANIWFVDSAHAGAGDTVGHGRNPDRPFATLAYAFSSDLVGNGDIVYLAPTHAESIGSAGAITMDIAGVKVVGCGQGAKRPTFTWTNTAGTIVISATSVSLHNVLTQVTVDEVVKMFDITGAFCELDRVDFRLAEAAEEAIQWANATAAATDLWIHHCRHHQATPANSNAQWIEFIGARSVIEDNTFDIELTSNSASKILSNGTAAIGLVVARNRIHALGNACIPISCHASSEGIAHDNRVVSGGTLAGKIALGGLLGCENYCATTANKNGILDPVVA